mmetsp:Transcript_11559/g.20501  ORF Transcript_11559/g.20501 Transcript_11559/m.20501 type:complete len:294 (+) Transcript_11559:547-1428(+)
MLSRCSRIKADTSLRNGTSGLRRSVEIPEEPHRGQTKLLLMSACSMGSKETGLLQHGRTTQSFNNFWVKAQMRRFGISLSSILFRTSSSLSLVVTPPRSFTPWLNFDVEGWYLSHPPAAGAGALVAGALPSLFAASSPPSSSEAGGLVSKNVLGMPIFTRRACSCNFWAFPWVIAGPMRFSEKLFPRLAPGSPAWLCLRAWRFFCRASCDLCCATSQSLLNTSPVLSSASSVEKRSPPKVSISRSGAAAPFDAAGLLADEPVPPRMRDNTPKVAGKRLMVSRVFFGIMVSSPR